LGRGGSRIKTPPISLIASKRFITPSPLARFMCRSSNSVPGGRRDAESEGLHLRHPHPLLIAIMITLLLFMTGSAMGAALTVGSGESIQAAINEAKEGDAVIVEAGVYRENLVLDEGITLQGTGRPLIDAGSSGSGVTLRAEGIVIMGFEVSGSGPGERDAGIRVLAENCTVMENLVVGNSVGILLQDVRGVVINRNEIERNEVGIFLETSYGNEICSNRIAENGEGIHMTRSNVSDSITASDAGGVSIKYRPKTEASILKVSEIGFAGAYQDNVVYGNELLNNGQNAYDDGDNLWYDGMTGNHYDDFDAIEEGCRDRNRDGVCDSPREIPGGSSIDEYPVASEDALRRYRSVSGDFELILYQSTFSPGEVIPLSFKAAENFTGRADLVASGSGLGSDEGTGQGTNDAGTAISSLPLEGSKGTVVFTAPTEEGSYTFSMRDGSGDEIVSLSFAVATPVLTVAVASASTCDRVNVSYTGAPGFEGDWVGLYKVGSGDESPVSRRYLDGTSNGTLTFVMPSSAGSYEFRIFGDDGADRLASSGPIEVKASSGVRITASPANARPGQAITVSFWGAKPDSAIGMYEMTRPDKYMLAMQWTNGRSCGTMTFSAPRTPGRYDFRFFEDNVHRKLMGASNVVIVS
jgi:nitrous oxidase accessory protein